jgi:hypothetical protein
VRQQVPDRDVAARVIVLYLESREIPADRRGEIDLLLLDQPHDRRGGEGLRNRRDRRDRVGRDGLRIVHVGDAEPPRHPLPVLDDAEGHAGDAVLGHLLPDERRQLLEAGIRRGGV